MESRLKEIPMSSYLLVRAKVQNFDSWKKAYDAHLSVRQEYGLSEERLLRGADDPNDVVLLFKASSLDRAKAFMNNPAIGEVIQKSGVVGKPDVTFLNS
jgi:hypothetical protein